MAVARGNRWLFTVDDFTRMVAAGILHEDDRVELIDGEVRPMSPIGPPHSAVVNRLTALLSRQVADVAIVSVQNPIQLTAYTAPQPDLALLRPRDDFYAAAHPKPADVLLVIEVADTSADEDRRETIPRYAQGRIPEAWLVDIPSRTVECYRRPARGRYRVTETLAPGQTLVASGVPGLRLAVEAIFGAAAGEPRGE